MNEKKTVRVFAWASFLNDLGSDMIYPFWPFFVTTVLGADMAVLGFIDGLGDAIVSVSQAVSGYFSDRLRKRKVFIWLGYLFGSLSRIGYAMSVVWQHLIPLRVLDRAGKMRGAPRDAIIAEISTNEDRGKNFGFLRAMDNLGAVVGILLSILLIGFLGYRKLFLVAAIPSLIGVLLILIFIKERKTEAKIYKGISLKDVDSNFRLFILLSSVFAVSAFSYSFLLVYAKQAGFQIAFIPVLYLIFTFTASISSMPFGKLSDRIGRKSVIMMSFAIWGLVCLSIILFHSYAAVIIAFVLYGLHKGAMEPVQKAFVSELAPKEYKASSLGGFQMAVGLVALPSSVIAGLLWDKIGVSAPFYLSLALTFASMLMLVFVKEKNLK
ncbi:MFS transporter [Candidatus Woesearchaeota archaeon]|nr:MFS transporter [Candidatus Woesearchaeota archaeon]